MGRTATGCAFLVFFAVTSALLSGCQHFVQVDAKGSRPVFSWPGDGAAVGLTVRPVLADCDFEGPHAPDELWWHISGEIRSPVTYGVVPKGATQAVAPRPLTDECSTWVVTITDQTMRGESTEFRRKRFSR